MSRIDKEMHARTEGMALAYKIAKEQGLDELAKELKFRTGTGISINMTMKDLNKASNRIKEMTIDTFMIMSIAALHDEFGFGEKRIQRFMDKFEQGADYLANDFATWQDYIDAIKEELNLELRIRWNN